MHVTPQIDHLEKGAMCSGLSTHIYRISKGINKYEKQSFFK